jgi:murein DD-endopeptidase MepM/ murein hydrolase activator NlpD
MRKSTLSTITLATLICLSTSAYLPVSSAYAATKSAISPDLKIPSAPATIIEIHSESAAPAFPVNKPVIEVVIDNRAATQDNSNLVNPDNAEFRRSQDVEIVLENRSTGCQYKASSLLERDFSLCNPDPAIATKQNRSPNPQKNQDQNDRVLYTASSGTTAVEVRRLNSQEIAAMSLPSNGDKQMLFPLLIPSEISSLFGSRVHPITGQVRMHQGTDLAAPEGTPVVAAFSGRVEIAGWLGGYGLIVVISHGDSSETRYAHLSKVFVKSGQEVKQGNVVGLVGSTGMATGPHLHFEIWKKIKGELVAIDPTPRLQMAMQQLQKYLAQSSKPRSGV